MLLEIIQVRLFQLVYVTMNEHYLMSEGNRVHN